MIIFQNACMHPPVIMVVVVDAKVVAIVAGVVIIGDSVVEVFLIHT